MIVSHADFRKTQPHVKSSILSVGAVYAPINQGQSVVHFISIALVIQAELLDIVSTVVQNIGKISQYFLLTSGGWDGYLHERHESNDFSSPFM